MSVLRMDQRKIDKTNDDESSRAIPDPAYVQAHHIMSTDIVAADPETSVKDLAKLLVKHKISAVPVMEGRNLVGIVSEGDLIQREEIGTATSLPGSHSERTNASINKSHGLCAKDVMSPNVMTISDTSLLAEIVEIMHSKGINRLPVMTADELLGGEKLAGIVSRSDIVRLLAKRPTGAEAPTQADDDIIRYKVIDTLLAIPGTSPWLTDVQVNEGIVTLSGTTQVEDSVGPSRQAVTEIEYVKKVIDQRVILQPY